MVMLLLVAGLAWAGASHAASLSGVARFFAIRRDANASITTFVESLKLQQAQAQAVQDYLGKDSNVAAYLDKKTYDKAKLAASSCGTVEILLGEGSIDTPPIDEVIARDSWSQTVWATPSCIAFPKSADEAASIIKTIKFLSTRFSVRSGGHSPSPGHSTVDGAGILIDLKNLNKISVSSDRKVATVGPGARWGSVYALLDGYGLSVIGARIPHVGVGGTFFGGGFFHFSGEFGMAADNVKNFEVVLANGSIVNANAEQNTDLFWALKGGGPNYGIVTKYDLYTIPVRNIWYQVGIHDNAQVPAILDAFAAWQNKGSADLKSTVALIIGLDSTTLGFFYSEHATKPAAFEPFYNITPLAAAIPPTNGTVQTLTAVLGRTFSGISQRHDYRAASTKVDAQLFKDVYKFWAKEAAAVHASTGANMTFTLQPIPANLAKAGTDKGGNPMGIPAQTHQWWTTLIDWTDAKDDAAVRAVPIATEKKWKELGQKKGSYLPHLFLNDASRDQSPLASYGTENLKKLKSIAAKYDPEQVFQTLQNGGFLLSKA